MIFKLKPFKSSSNFTLPSNFSSLLLKDYTELFISSTIQQTFSDSSFFFSNHSSNKNNSSPSIITGVRNNSNSHNNSNNLIKMNWSVFRDLLYDIKQITASTIINDDNKTNNDLNNLQMLSIQNRKFEHTTKFSYAIKYNILSNSSEIIAPQYRNSFTLQTKTDKYIFIASNKYLMWMWIKTIKKF